ncbi:ABC transporter ATP-binding protein [Peribacillus cavernae]|nr:ABC transporter ATP-binding protein [Peribacillus cavernae]MDQ0219200.1 iron(III) transport system ATP-binding protein [Peribacillus cavernae]
MIQIEHLDKQYGVFTALVDINLTVLAGEFIAILGPSGCGKTTLLKLLAGFIKPTAGQIMLNGELVGSAHSLKPPEKRNLGMVFQSFALWPHMTVEEHILFPLKHHRFAEAKRKQDQRARVDTVLQMVGLESLKKRYPSELSGGQGQRVALARAIAPRPSILLMDEPLSALDAELRIEMRKEIQTIHRQTGTTVVYVTHDQGEALAMADRIVVMNQGRVEQVDSPETIYTRPKSVFVSRFVGKSNVMEGQWISTDTFMPKGFPSVQWKDLGVSLELKRQNVYPIRPEQWKLEEPSPGQLNGKVLFAQFQGNEVHYTVSVEEQLLTIYSPIYEKRYEPGNEVSVRLRIPANLLLRI